MKNLISVSMVVLMVTGVSFAVVFEDFEDGDYTSNPAWWVSTNVGAGLITNDPIRPDNLVWKAYGTDTAHRILETNVSGIGWNNFDISLEYKVSASGNFHGAWFFYPEEGITSSFRFGLWYDTQKDPDARIYVIENGPVAQDVRTWIPIGNIPRNQWLKLHSWYDIGSGLIISEARILETDTLIGQVSMTPALNLSQAGEIASLGIGIEESNWQYMDNVAFIPEPTTLSLLALGALPLLRRKRKA